MTGITPFLWFDDQAEEAVNQYVSIFPNSRVLRMSRMGEGGKVMTASFELDGRRYTAMNGGPHYKLTPAFSLVVQCETQEEVDHYWDRLSADPAAEQCGWLKDRFGLSWQIIPNALPELLGDKDPEKAKRAMQAMLAMKKIDIEGLRKAHAGA